MPKGPQGQRQPYKYVRDLCMGAGFLAGYLIYRLTGHPQLVYTFIPVGGMLVGFGVGFFLKKRLIANAQRS